MHPNYEPGDVKRQHFFTDGNVTGEDVRAALEANSPLVRGINVNALADELARRKAYNEGLRKLDRLHASYRPKRGGALLRVKMYEGYESGSIMVPYEGRVRIDEHKQAASYVKDPFNFCNTAVVVAVHQGDEYEPGMMVHIDQPISFQQRETGMILYSNWFIHPSYPTPDFPYNKYESKYYGYIFIPSAAIIGVIEDAPEELEIVDYES